jgi:hypothetical protein
MAAFSRVVLSGSTNGRPIPVAATATAGTLIHTATSLGSDEVWLWVSNVTGSAATLTIEWGGVTDPGDHLCKSVSISANSGPTLVAAGIAIAGGLAVRAFSGTASALNLSGYVNRVQ